jgi:hypothetical protein
MAYNLLATDGAVFQAGGSGHSGNVLWIVKQPSTSHKALRYLPIAAVYLSGRTCVVLSKCKSARLMLKSSAPVSLIFCSPCHSLTLSALVISLKLFSVPFAHTSISLGLLWGNSDSGNLDSGISMDLSNMLFRGIQSFALFSWLCHLWLPSYHTPTITMTWLHRGVYLVGMETKWSKFEWGPSCFDPPYEISVEKRKTLVCTCVSGLYSC